MGTEYTGLQSLLNATLGDEYMRAGFCLVEQGDHVLVLFYRDEQVAVFMQSGATIPAIREACREHLTGMVAR